MVDFDEEHWLRVIRSPDWYLEFREYVKQVDGKLGGDSVELGKFRRAARHFFEIQLEQGKVALAGHGPNQDAEREPVDTIVIHHTSAEPGYRLPYMNATQLLNVYVPVFTDGPIWSNHLRNGKQIFYVYHWLMRMDGSFERLLSDDQIGWHAGNWEINKCSVAICLDNDYEEQDPTDVILQKLVAHIRKNYPDIESRNIIGHCEARSGTICPGTNFVDIWKPKLLQYF